MGSTFKIHPEWDAALTYDAVTSAAAGDRGATRPVFVGRRDLMDIIVGTIRQPERRGTFLISGYRGAGKTTLLIESICRAAADLPSPYRLLPLVLNASEVSASLGPAPTGPALQIGPQQLLAALIRRLRNVAQSRPKAATSTAAAPPTGSERLLDSLIRTLRRTVWVRPETATTEDREGNGRLSASLIDAIEEAYRKANAKEYSRSEATQKQETETRSWGTELKLNSADVFKGLTGLTALAAVSLEGSRWFSGGMAGLHAAAAGLAGVAILSGLTAWKLSRTAKQERTRAVSVKFDGSLQQLETDLKDVLTGLHHEHFRPVVVLEELDKLRDEDGQQLDAVIRYFKNLFTEAPALFFFVTDKAYYDFISAQIRSARRERSYAIQHTFFTHRLFVGRPTTRDCLDYFRNIALDPEVGKRLDALYAPDGLSPFSAEIGNDPLLRLVRYLLFKASNHLFDLKNELRRFVRTDGVDLVIDTDLLTEDEAALGALQDLVFEKIRSFAIGDGRAYANEVLNDCVCAVFNDLASDVEQTVASFYPRALEPRRPSASPPVNPAASTDVPAPATAGAAKAQENAAKDTGQAQEKIIAEDQLELTEQIRIKDAVDSMIADLQRGDAFEAEKTNIAQGRFVWKRTAARAFRFKRQLDRHERALATRLEGLRAAVASLGGQGLLGAQAGVTGVADRLVAELADRVQQIQGGGRALSVDEAANEGTSWQHRAAEPIDAAYRAHLKRVADSHGFRFTPAGRSEGGSLFLLETPLGDPRGRQHQSGGAVLVAQGEGGRLVEDARDFVTESRNLQRLAIIHVFHSPAEPALATALTEKWRTDLADQLAREIPGMAVPRVLEVDVVPLDEEWPAADIATRWGERLVSRILFRASWVALAITPNWTARDLTGFVGTADDQGAAEPFTAVVRRWLRGPQRILGIMTSQDSSSLTVACVEAMRSPDIGSAVALPLTPGDVDPLGQLREQILRTAGGEHDKDDRVTAVVAGLIGERSVIPILDATEGVRKDLLPLLGDRGGMMLIALPSSPRSLAVDGEPISTLTFTPDASPAPTA